MSDLIKRDDALAAIDTFNRDFEQSWKVQFSADIKALPAIDPAAIREAALVSAVAKQIGEEHGWVRQERLDEAEAKLTKAGTVALETILIERGPVFDAMVDAAEDAAGKDVSYNVVVGRAIRAALAELEGM